MGTIANLFGSKDNNNNNNNNDYKNSNYDNTTGSLPMVQAIPVAVAGAIAGAKAATAANAAAAEKSSAAVPLGTSTTAPAPAPIQLTTKSPLENAGKHDFFLMLGREPTIMHQCPRCNATNIRTRVTTYPSIISWILLIAIALMCFYGVMPTWMFPLALVPLLYDKLKTSDHYCGQCNKKVGSVSPMTDCGVKHLT